MARRTLLFIAVIQFSIISDFAHGNNNANNNNTIHIEVWYQELPPFMYTDKNGHLTGIFVTYMDSVRRSYCKELYEQKIQTIVTYTKYKTDGSMDSLTNHTFSFPVTRKNDSVLPYKDTYITERLFSSKSIAVIVQTRNINFAYKFLMSFLNIKLLLALIVYSTLTIALLIWIMVSLNFFYTL